MSEVRPLSGSAAAAGQTAQRRQTEYDRRAAMLLCWILQSPSPGMSGGRLKGSRSPYLYGENPIRRFVLKRVRATVLSGTTASVAGRQHSCRAALSASTLHSDLGQDRERDFLRGDGAEIEAGRRLDAVERRGIDTLRDEFCAQRRHLAPAADEGVIGGFNRDRRAQGRFVALALGRDHHKAPGLLERAEPVAVDHLVGI